MFLHGDPTLDVDCWRIMPHVDKVLPAECLPLASGIKTRNMRANVVVGNAPIGQREY